MLATTQTDRGDFWELMHAALGLQHNAARLAEQGRPEDAAYYERQAVALLLEATCLLDAEEPAMGTVRQLATAGLARLHGLKKVVRAAERAAERARRAPAEARPQRARKPVAARAARARSAS
jgi:HEPN domain-containing protein